MLCTIQLEDDNISDLVQISNISTLDHRIAPRILNLAGLKPSIQSTRSNLYIFRASFDGDVAVVESNYCWSIGVQIPETLLGNFKGWYLGNHTSFQYLVSISHAPISWDLILPRHHDTIDTPFYPTAGSSHKSKINKSSQIKLTNTKK